MEIKNNDYPHKVFTGFLQSLELISFLGQNIKPVKEILVICDSNTQISCYPILRNHLIEYFPIDIVSFPEGEINKNLDTCNYILSSFLERNVSKDSLIINLGGGVVSDVGGFCASIYHRGIPFINIPTSLMAMVDAALGGKTGVDLNNYKNIIGVINFPKAVFVDAGFLKTLPKREFLSGYNEMIKHGLIADRKYFMELTENEHQVDIEKAIKRSIEIKMDIVVNDPYEIDVRKFLNFGHTIGHGIESVFLKFSDKSVLHGEAILAGMLAESFISEQIGLLNRNEFDEIIDRLKPRLPKLILDKNAIEEVVMFLIRDKKHSSEQLNFTLIESIGKAVIDRDVSLNTIRQSLIFISELTNRQ